MTTAYQYDPTGRVKILTHANGTTILNAQSYTYDAVGNRTSFTTDIAQPLITQPRTSVYDDDNRLVQSEATTYTYDDNGNLVAQVDPRGITMHTWGARNRLVSIVTADGQTTNFLYDFAGNLVQQRVEDTGPALIQDFILDDLTNVVHTSSSDGNRFSIVTGRGIDEHLAVIRSEGQLEFGLSDTTNSTVTTTDENGSIGARFFYEPFGQTTPGSSGYPFQYTGRVPVLGNLYYYRARYYDSLVGRFVSEDPIGFLGGDDNFYQYVYNNPIRGIDPYGLGKLDIYNPTELEKYIFESYLNHGINDYAEDTSELIELENSFRKSKPAKECKIFRIKKEEFKLSKPPIDFKEI